MKFRSRRIPTDLGLNRLALARARLGVIPFDLTVSNPTNCEIAYPPALLAGLADPRGLSYRPEPRGPIEARRAIAASYQQWGQEVDPNQIVLTASTSEAYSFLFRLLADPGDAVLVPAPSYPLFDHLARLDGVKAHTYRLDADTGWRIDFPSFETAPEEVRAVVVVHPNNPTGSLVHPDDARRLVELCRDRNWALIADEVFLPFPIGDAPGPAYSFAGIEDCLCFSLGGFSKSVGLPQFKLAWLVVGGPDDRVGPTLEALDYIADAYLSVSTPAALAAPQVLAAAVPVHEAITARCRKNFEVLHSLAHSVPAVTLPPLDGGWNAVLRVPAVMSDEELCLRLLEERGVAVHPGSPFNFAAEGYLVASLLPPERVFSEGLRRLLDFIARIAT